MNLLTIALAHLRRRRGKALFLFALMVVAVGVVVAMYYVTGMMRKEIADSFDRVGANITVVPGATQLGLSYQGVPAAGGGEQQAEIPLAEVKKIYTIKNRESIAAVAPKLVGAGKAGNREVLVIGVIFDEEIKMKRWWRWQGKKPAGKDEVMVGEKLAQELALKTGSRFNLGGQEYTVAAILARTEGTEDEAVLMDLREAQVLLGKPGLVNLVEVAALCSSCPIDEIMAQIKEKIPGVEVRALRDVLEARRMVVDRFAGFALIAAVLLFSFCLVVVATALAAEVRERTGEIGIMRAMGFRRSHVAAIVLAEALLVALPAGVVGYTAGVFVAGKAASLFVAATLERVTWDPVAALAVTGTALLTGLGAALLPAWQAARLDPVSALRAM